jgi:RNA polymerase sigma factor (sigma-70 family)
VNELELVKAAQAGDRSALIQLLKHVEKHVYRTAFYMLGNEQDALDASQEALLRIYHKISTYEEKAKFSTWVQRIVTNICIDQYRKRKEWVSLDEQPMQIEDQWTVEDQILQNDAKKNISEAIQQLPAPQRLVITLRYVQDLSYAEIADTLELPINTVKSHLFRARQHLAGLLSDYKKGGVHV